MKRSYDSGGTAKLTHGNLRFDACADRLSPSMPTPDAVEIRRLDGPAADVEHALAGRNPREVGERRGELDRVHPHEAVVRLGRHCEAHHRESTLRRVRRPTIFVNADG